MDKCSLSVTYLGVKVNLEFKGGDIMSKKNGTLTTSNPFVQAAIESMPSFGKKIVLKTTYSTRSAVSPVQSANDERVKPRLARTKPNAAELRKGQKVAEPKSEIVESVKNINDAASYFMEKGEAVESKEQLEELMQKYNVVFPNMK